jgi:hypothetical protein
MPWPDDEVAVCLLDEDSGDGDWRPWSWEDMVGIGLLRIGGFELLEAGYQLLSTFGDDNCCYLQV